ncbi:major facilitator superfamily transporter [Phlyctema vagabunda]|uniref:Major facilitator superfamily transporter n=1 Tax=Phlyctema vagabunda TaxID=108571 RepID=A0ABR4P362_9HELO
MAELDRLSSPGTNGNSGDTENDLEAAGRKTEAAPDVEALPQPKQQERVPRSQRRGILGSLAIIPEITNPYEYNNGMKWLFTAIVALAGTTSSTGSSILYPALHVLADDFGDSADVANLSLAFYMLAMAVTPLWWSEYSESFGRRSIYLVSFTFFVIFAAISAVSVNMGMFIVFRLLMGGAAASVQAVGSGTIADIWEPKERGKAMGVFMLGPLCGPGIAPIIGGALTQAFGWRSTQWYLTIFGGVVLTLILFCLPETLRRKAVQPHENEGGPKAKLTVGRFLFKCVEPLKILGLLRHPAIFVAVYAAGISFGVMFVGYVELQATFPFAPYNFSDTIIGLFYLAPTIGYAISSVLGGRWLDYIMKREAQKAGRVGEDGKARYLPEDRMKENMWIGAVLYPACFVWFGWAADKGLHWTVAAVPLVLFGIFGMILYGAIATALTEFTPNRTSSGLALNNFVRNILSFIAAVVTQPLIDAIGVGWTTTMVSLFSLVTILPALATLYFRSAKWRVTMDRKLANKAM